MNDDLKFKNIPSAELEKLSREIEEKKIPDENLTQTSDSSSENIPFSENPDVPETQALETSTDIASNINNDYNSPDVQNDQSSVSDDQQLTSETSSAEVNPQSDEVNNVSSQSNAVQSVKQYPPNTNSNRPPRTNTLRNRNAYPPNNAYYQNGYNYPTNANTNTVRNRNAYPQNNYPQNAYQYPRNVNNPVYPNYYAQAPQNQAYAPPYYYQSSPKELEKLALSKDSSTAGKVTIAIYIVMFIVAIIIEFIAVFCGVSKDVPDLANDPYAGFTPMGFYMYEGLTSLLSIFIPTLIIIKASGKKINRLMPFKKIEGKKLFAIIMCGMSLCMVAQLMASLIGINLGLFGIDIYKGLETATATGVLDLIMGTICTAIIPALVEEFAYRGLVAGILKEHDEMLAVFGSAFLFGMLHGNFGQIPFAFVVGLVLGYARVKTDSMLPGILIHFGNNFYATVITILDEIVPEPYSVIIDSVVILVLIVAGFIAAHYLVKNHKDLFKIEKKQSYMTYKEKLGTFLKTGTVIASVIILTIMSFVILLVV